MKPAGPWPYPFTVLTPTYNRAHTLGRAYASLKAQSLGDFEWVVVDDGSTDQTPALVEEWGRTSPFPIRYFHQPNQHKKTAFNRGVREAQGEFVVALDSDDTLVPGALEEMAAIWAEIPEQERCRFVAITGLCARPDGKVVGDRFPREPFDVSALDLTFRYRIGGEKFGCLRTEILRRFPFPEQIEGFVPESLVWRAMARAGYLNRCVNRIFRVYHDSADSLSEEGRNSARHAFGLLLLAQDTLVECLPWFRHDPRAFLMAAVRYSRFGLHARDQGRPLPPDRRLRGIVPRMLVALMWPAGAMLYLRDRMRR